jgi:hypothetical protein
MKKGFGVLAAAGILFAAQAVSAFDATGTWAGKWKCKYTAGSVSEKESCDPCQMWITQNGNELYIQMAADPNNTDFDYYDGVAHARADDANRGNAGAEYCGNDGLASDDWSEVINFKKVDMRAGKEMIKGKSAVQDPNSGPGSCTYSFKRTSSADPGLLRCGWAD